MALLLSLLLLLPARLLLAGDWWPVHVNTNTGEIHIGPWSPSTGHTNWWLTPTNGSGAFGDVYSSSNNVFSAHTTQAVDTIIVSNRLQTGNQTYEATHAGQNWKGWQIWTETNGHGYIVGPYSGLEESETWFGRWSNTPGETYDWFWWVPAQTKRFTLIEHLVVTNGDIEVGESTWIGPTAGADLGLNIDPAGNATLSGTLNGIAPASWATNAGVGPSFYGMSNFVWVALDWSSWAGGASAWAWVDNFAEGYTNVCAWTNDWNLGVTSPVFCAKLTWNQVLTNGATPTIRYDSVEYDSHSWWNSTDCKYVPQVAGYYQVSARMGAAYIPDKKRMSVDIYKETSVGVAAEEWAASQNGANDALRLSCAGLVYCDGVDDKIYVVGFQNSGSSVTLDIGTTTRNRLSIHLVRRE